MRRRRKTMRKQKKKKLPHLVNTVDLIGHVLEESHELVVTFLLGTFKCLFGLLGALTGIVKL